MSKDHLTLSPRQSHHAGEPPLGRHTGHRADAPRFNDPAVNRMTKMARDPNASHHMWPLSAAASTASVGCPIAGVGLSVHSESPSSAPTAREYPGARHSEYACSPRQGVADSSSGKCGQLNGVYRSEASHTSLSGQRASLGADWSGHQHSLPSVAVRSYQKGGTRWCR